MVTSPQPSWISGRRRDEMRWTIFSSFLTPNRSMCCIYAESSRGSWRTSSSFRQKSGSSTPQRYSCWSSLSTLVTSGCIRPRPGWSPTGLLLPHAMNLNAYGFRKLLPMVPPKLQFSGSSSHRTHLPECALPVVLHG